MADSRAGAFFHGSMEAAPALTLSGTGKEKYDTYSCECVPCRRGL